MPYRDDLNILKYNQGVILLHTLATDSLFCGEFSAEHNFIKKLYIKFFYFSRCFSVNCKKIRWFLCLKGVFALF